MLALGILACCQAAPPPSDGGAEPNIHFLLDAAVRADLEPLKRALATESGRREICRTVDGISVVHMLLGGLHTAVAGEISRLVGWSGENKHRTLYRHELIEGISAQIQPVLADILRLSPQLVHAANLTLSLTGTLTLTLTSRCSWCTPPTRCTQHPQHVDAVPSL